MSSSFMLLASLRLRPWSLDDDAEPLPICLRELPLPLLPERLLPCCCCRDDDDDDDPEPLPPCDCCRDDEPDLLLPDD